MAIKFLESGTAATFGTEFWSGPDSAVGASSDSSEATRSLKIVSSGAGSPGRVSSPDNILLEAGRRISFYFKATDLPSSAVAILRTFRAAASLSSFVLNITSGGLLQFGQDWSGFLTKSGTTPLSTGTWYRLCVTYVITDATHFTLKLFLNGSLEITATQTDLTELNSSNLRMFELGWLDAGQGNSKQVNFRDVYVDDDTSNTDTGDIKVTAKLPASNNVNNFNTSIGANPANRWTNVNERALSETNGWEETALAAVEETYGIQSASGGDVDISTATIVGRSAWIWAKEGTGGLGTPKLVNNGSDVAVTLTATAAIYTDLVASATYPATAGVIGMKSAGALDTTFLYECGMLIAYTPAAGGGSGLALSLLATGIGR